MAASSADRFNLQNGDLATSCASSSEAADSAVDDYLSIILDGAENITCKVCGTAANSISPLTSVTEINTNVKWSVYEKAFDFFQAI